MNTGHGAFAEAQKALSALVRYGRPAGDRRRVVFLPVQMRPTSPGLC